MPINSNLAMLTGNGLSIAFSDNLMLDNITTRVIERLTKFYGGGGDEVAQAMQKVAIRAQADDPSGDFESLIGAFGGQTDILEDLAAFAELTEGSTDIRTHIYPVLLFVEQVKRRGIGHTLEIIVENSRSDVGTLKPISDFLRVVTGAFANQITVANLNYDTLLLSALTADYKEQFCDMAHGGNSSVERKLSTTPFTSYPLRSSAAEFPEWLRIRLLDLHGSVSFWKIRASCHKIPIEIARDPEVWRKYRERETFAFPLVVLANQHDKADHVNRYPYKIAYEVAEADFRNAEHWLIVGYSFRDTCVNDLLRRCWKMRFREPRILIVTKGDGPTDEDVESAFGWESGTLSDHDVTIERGGVVGLGETSAWASFAGT